MLASIVAIAQEDEQSSKRPSRTVAPVEVGEFDPVEIMVGSSTTIRIPIRVAKGYRIQANPASSEFLVPVEIALVEVDGLVFGVPVYPDSEPYRLEGADDDLMTYRGDFEIVVPVSADETAAPGSRAVRGDLRFQACNSTICLFPASVPLDVRLSVSAFEAPAGD